MADNPPLYTLDDFNRDVGKPAYDAIVAALRDSGDLWTSDVRPRLLKAYQEMQAWDDPYAVHVLLGELLTLLPDPHGEG